MSLFNSYLSLLYNSEYSDIALAGILQVLVYFPWKCSLSWLHLLCSPNHFSLCLSCSPCFFSEVCIIRLRQNIKGGKLFSLFLFRISISFFVIIRLYLNNSFRTWMLSKFLGRRFWDFTHWWISNQYITAVQNTNDCVPLGHYRCWGTNSKIVPSVYFVGKTRFS